MIKEILESREKFKIIAGVGEDILLKYAKTPKEAITLWTKLQGKYSSKVQIEVDNKKDAKELYNWVFNNLDEYIQIIKYQKTYKPNYLYKEVQAVNLDKIDVRYGLHPFNIG